MNKPWIQHYDEGVSEHFHTVAEDLVSLFSKKSQQFAGHPALTSFSKTICYQDLAEKVDALAYQFQRLGLKPKDHLGLMMPNCFQYAIALLAGLKCGLVIVNINPLATTRECAYEFEDARLKGLICFENAASRVMRALALFPVPIVVVTRLGDELPRWKNVLLQLVLKLSGQIPRWTILGAVHWATLMNQGHGQKPDKVEICPEDLAFLQYTGGTTGEPKAAMLTHANLVANISQCLAWVGPKLREGEEKVLVALPLYHIFSLTVCFWTFIALGGESVLITNPRDTKRLIKTIQSTKPSVWVGVNTLFHAMLQKKTFQKLDFSALKVAIAGGMALHESVANTWQKITGNCLLEGYGLSETSPVLTVNPTAIRKHNGSIGLPIPGTEIAIMNGQGKALPFDEVGEICARGPQVMQGYWQKNSAEVFFDGGWFRTGDLGRMNAQGYITLVDRQKDMILVSGFNVYPNEVETVLTQHPQVLEAGVVGIPCQASGETVVAFVVLKTTLSDRQLVRYCQTHLTRYKVPKHFFRVETLPKTPVGKVLRKALRAEAAAKTL